MIAQARAELPNECCGLLAGLLDADGRLGRAVKRYPLVNAAASPREYLSDPRSMFAAFKDWRQHGLEVLAVYHSHPTAPPVPSRKDLEMNYSPDAINLIISLQGDEPVMRGWWLSADAYAEAQWELME
jgi:proteasome lid subunit RPN8/RPN11